MPLRGPGIDVLEQPGKLLDHPALRQFCVHVGKGGAEPGDANLKRAYSEVNTGAEDESMSDDSLKSIKNKRRAAARSPRQPRRRNRRNVRMMSGVDFRD